MQTVSHWTPRRPPRHSHSLSCQVVREKDFKLVARRIINVSETGLLVKPIARVLTGEELIVSFQAPFSRVWIDAEAIVVRVIHGRRYSDYGMMLGLWLHGLDDVSRALLRTNIADLPHVPRGRSARRLGDAALAPLD